MLAYLLGRMLNQSFRIASTPRCCFRANVDEIPRVIIVFAENLFLHIMQQRDEFIEEALSTFFGHLPIQCCHATPKHSTEVIHVLAWWHPTVGGNVSQSKNKT